MNILTSIVSFILLCAVFFFPFLILYYLNKKHIKYRFIGYLVFGIIVAIVMIFIFSWWTTISDEMLLSHYGYNFDAINEVEKYANVLPKNINQVKNIESSLSGIGWTLKAIFASAFYLPYLFVVYLVNYIIKRRNAIQ